MADTKPTSLSHMDIPVLEGWVLLADAAARLGITRTHVSRLVREGELTQVRRLGESNFYVVSVEEVDKRIEQMNARDVARDAAREAKASS